MRARYPDVEGIVERDGVSLGYELFGDGKTTVVLMPTWTILHSRFWKMQVPYLSRYYRVVTYDGPGNGKSDRVTDPARYSADAYARDAKTVMDRCGIDNAAVVGVSLGAQYGARLATLYPDRVSGLALVGAALPLSPPVKERAVIADRFFEPFGDEPRGWEKYNLAYWHDHYQDFVEFFFRQVFVEPHSTKPVEDAVGWAMEGGPEYLAAEAGRPEVASDGSLGSIGLAKETAEVWRSILEELTCPVLAFHGPTDRIQPYDNSVEVTRITGGSLMTLEGSGHMPNVRDPVRFNLSLREFIEEVAA
jgi:pimeloyl-ACP methyl ester carboxylesterase